MSLILWPLAKILSVLGLLSLPLILSYGLVWGFAVRGRWPGFSGAIRRGFWIMLLFGAAVTVPVPLSVSLLLVDLLLLGLGLSFHASHFPRAIRQYGRVQTWAALLCLVDFGVLQSSELLDHPHLMGCSVAQAALTAICLQLLMVGIGVWLSVMLPLIIEMRRASR